MSRKGIIEPSQARARKTEAAIMQGLERLLKDRAFDRITVADIAKEAGVSVGAVYRRFEDKAAFIPLLLDLYKERLARYEAESRRAAEAAPDTLRAALEAAMVSAWEVMARDGHLLRAIHLHARLNPDLVDDSFAPMLEASRASIDALFEAYKDEITVADRARAVDAVTYFLNTILIEEGLYGALGPQVLALSGRDLAVEMARMAYAYLTSFSGREK